MSAISGQRVQYKDTPLKELSASTSSNTPLYNYLYVCDLKSVLDFEVAESNMYKTLKVISIIAATLIAGVGVIFSTLFAPSFLPLVFVGLIVIKEIFYNNVFKTLHGYQKAFYQKAIDTKNLIEKSYSFIKNFPDTESEIYKIWSRISQDPSRDFLPDGINKKRLVIPFAQYHLYLDKAICQENATIEMENEFNQIHEAFLAANNRKKSQLLPHINQLSITTFLNKNKACELKAKAAIELVNCFYPQNNIKNFIDIIKYRPENSILQPKSESPFIMIGCEEAPDYTSISKEFVYENSVEALAKKIYDAIEENISYITEKNS